MAIRTLALVLLLGATHQAPAPLVWSTTPLTWDDFQGLPDGTNRAAVKGWRDAPLLTISTGTNNVFPMMVEGTTAGMAAALVSDEARADADKIAELYVRALARQPNADELSAALSYLHGAEDRRRAYEDIVWALVNTKEFLFNH